MKNHKNYSLYDNKVLLNKWDFLANKDINVFETTIDSNQEVTYVCPKCGKSTKGPLNKIYPFHCSYCDHKYFYKRLRITDETIYILKQTLWVLYTIGLILLMYVVGSGIVNKVSLLAYRNDTYLIILFAFLLSQLIIMLKVISYRLSKSKLLLYRKHVFVRLISEYSGYEDFDLNYGRTLKNRLLALISRNNENADTNHILEECIKNKININKYFIRSIRDKFEFRRVLKEYNEKFYYSEIYPLYAVAKLSYRNNKVDPLYIVISIAVSILSLLYKIHFDLINKIPITDMVFDILGICLVVLLVGIWYYNLKKYWLNRKILNKICYVIINP